MERMGSQVGIIGTGLGWIVARGKPNQKTFGSVAQGTCALAKNR